MAAIDRDLNVVLNMSWLQCDAQVSYPDQYSQPAGNSGKFRSSIGPSGEASIVTLRPLTAPLSLGAMSDCVAAISCTVDAGVASTASRVSVPYVTGYVDFAGW
jgi:hypothetical protein